VREETAVKNCPKCGGKITYQGIWGHSIECATEGCDNYAPPPLEPVAEAQAGEGEETPCVYISLHEGGYDDQGKVLCGEEISYPGYERVRVPRDDAHWKAGTGWSDVMCATNKTLIAFPRTKPPCSGRVAYFGVSYSPNGLPLISGELDRSEQLFSGMNVSFPPESLSISFEDLDEAAEKAAK
jgi:hypothetical protein